MILALVEETPDITLEELRAALARRGLAVGYGTPLAFLRAATDHAQKKTAHAAEQDRPDVLRRRQEWFDDQLDLDPARLVFIDETWASTKPNSCSLLDGMAWWAVGGF